MIDLSKNETQKSFVRVKLLLLLPFLLPLTSYAQNTNEHIKYSFKTKNNKQMTVSQDTVANTLIYRYGKVGNTELEIVDDLNDTIVVFTYYYYFRGGGVANAGLELYSLRFTNGGFEYTIYYSYSAETDDVAIGIEIHDLKTGKRYDIEGLPETQIGSLSVFRYSSLLPFEEED